jgi:hypothetical protein
VSNELESIWKEAVVTKEKVLPGGTLKNHKTRLFGFIVAELGFEPRTY